MNNEQSPSLYTGKSLYIRDELKDLYYAKDVVSALGDYLLDTSIGGFSEFSLE